MTVYNDDGILFSGRDLSYALGTNEFYFLEKENGNYDIFGRDGKMILESDFKLVDSVGNRILIVTSKYGYYETKLIDQDNNELLWIRFASKSGRVV